MIGRMGYALRYSLEALEKASSLAGSLRDLPERR